MPKVTDQEKPVHNKKTVAREKVSKATLINKIPHYIAVEAPLGSGKSEFSRKLAHKLRYKTLLEDADKNPFIDAFFKHNPKNALASHLYFLFERLHPTQNDHLKDKPSSKHISDFITEKDYFLAKTLLPAKEFTLYRKIFAQVKIEHPKPDLVIYLQMPTLSIQQRLEKAPYTHLESINPLFLEQVNDAYRQFFHYYDDTPLLIVNAADANFIDNPDTFFTLIEHLSNIQSGRHYFNPEFTPEMSL